MTLHIGWEKQIWFMGRSPWEHLCFPFLFIFPDLLMPLLPTRGMKFYVSLVVLVCRNRFAFMQWVETRGAARGVSRVGKKHLKAAEQLIHPVLEKPSHGKIAVSNNQVREIKPPMCAATPTGLQWKYTPGQAAQEQGTRLCFKTS